MIFAIYLFHTVLVSLQKNLLAWIFKFLKPNPKEMIMYKIKYAINIIVSYHENYQRKFLSVDVQFSQNFVCILDQFTIQFSSYRYYYREDKHRRE